MNDYTSSAACKLVAKNCCVCGRPLLRAESLRTGIGPDCADKFGAAQLLAGSPEESRANKIIYEIATIQRSNWNAIRPLLAELHTLGFGVVADRIAERLEPKKTQIRIVATAAGFRVFSPYSAAAVEAFKAIPGRKFGKEAGTGENAGKEFPYNDIPAAGKRALWNLLQEHYAGCFAETPKGTIEL